MKPSGLLHLGNLEGALRSWIELQAAFPTFCMIADWHAYTTPPVDPARIRRDARRLALDYLAAGLDPDRAAIFRQSDVKEHAELYLLLSSLTPVSWLTRVPTYKQTIETRKIESPSHGLLGYPVLQAADILLYRATIVPVGRDQLPHVELAREIARRFAALYRPVFVAPAARLGAAPALLGLDGRKMSKAHGNGITLADSPNQVAEKIRGAFTTPTKIHAADPGVPERCPVCLLRRIYDPEGWRASWDEDRAGARGCVENKRELAAIVNAALEPLRRRRRSWAGRPADLDAVLREGARKARAVAAETMEAVRRAMGLAPAGDLDGTDGDTQILAPWNRGRG